MKNIAAKIVGFFVGVIVMGSLLVGIRAYEKSQWRLESYEPDSYNWESVFGNTKLTTYTFAHA
jgi:hypothetical protein